MSQYREGTVSVTQGSAIVTGNGTQFTKLATGTVFWVRGDNISYIVASIQSDTQVTLSANYQGNTATGAFYIIAQDYTPNRHYPYPVPGDVDSVLIVARAIQQIDADMPSGGAAGVQTLDDLSDVDTAGSNTGSVLTKQADGTFKFETITTTGTVSATNAGTAGATIYRAVENGALVFRRLLAGSTKLTIAQNQDDVTIDIPEIGEANTGQNVGSASSTGLFKQKTGTALQFYSLLAGAGISLTRTNDDITIAATSSGTSTPAGESNTTSSVGTGVALTLPKSGVNLPFKSVGVVDGKMVVSDDGSTVKFGIGSINLSDLADLSVGTVAVNQTIVRNSAGKWVPYTIPAAGIANVQADTSPKLGGNLDVSGKDILGLTGDLSGAVAKPKVQVYTLILKTVHGMTLDSLTMRLGTGTATAAVRINGNPVTGLSINATTTTASVSASGANVAAIGAEIDISVSSVSSDAATLAFSIAYRRS